MKRLLLLSVIFLTACGLSQEEKENIAAVTCSIMSETRNMDAAVRVREMNDAREKIGGEPFLRGDDAIQEAFEWGLCQELVLNEIYDETLQPLKDAKRERERIAREERAEEQRIAAEERAEEQRIAAEERAEEQRIAAEERAEEQRIAAEERAEEQRIAAEERAEEQRIAENKRLIADAKRVEEERIAEAKRIDEERIGLSQGPDHVVKMLNRGNSGNMVFEPAVIKISVGDTIHFRAADKSHSSISIEGMIPLGQSGWEGSLSQDKSVTFDTEGVYVYKCEPHGMIGMLGVVQVGNAVNIKEIRAAAKAIKSSVIINADRLNDYLLKL